ncbi:autoinducer-2 (AI-2) kinase, partial [Pasteurella multocida subsp. multocida str. Anand1_buffalo]
DVTGLVVNIPVVKEATALGCAIAAGVGSDSTRHSVKQARN